MNLKNKVVIITGASRGLGKELALKLAQEKSKLVLVARNQNDLNKVKKEIKESEVITIKADVTNIKDVKRIFSVTKRKFKKVDILINNAGVNVKDYFYNLSEQDYDYIMNTNVKAVFTCTKESYKHMKKGKIVIISSVAGWFGAKYYSVYCASKHALEGFAKSIKQEVRKSVKVHIFHPYRMRTSFHKNYSKKSPEHHMLDSKFYAEYIVAVLKENPFQAFLLNFRNWVMWLGLTLKIVKS